MGIGIWGKCDNVRFPPIFSGEKMIML